MRYIPFLRGTGLSGQVRAPDCHTFQSETLAAVMGVRKVNLANPKKLETGLRTSRAGVPSRVLFRIEAIGFEGLGLLKARKPFLQKGCWDGLCKRAMTASRLRGGHWAGLTQFVAIITAVEAIAQNEVKLSTLNPKP